MNIAPYGWVWRWGKGGPRPRPYDTGLRAINSRPYIFFENYMCVCVCVCVCTATRVVAFCIKLVLFCVFFICFLLFWFFMFDCRGRPCVCPLRFVFFAGQGQGWNLAPTRYFYYRLFFWLLSIDFWNVIKL